MVTNHTVTSPTVTKQLGPRVTAVTITVTSLIIAVTLANRIIVASTPRQVTKTDQTAEVSSQAQVTIPAVAVTVTGITVTNSIGLTPRVTRVVTIGHQAGPMKIMDSQIDPIATVTMVVITVTHDPGANLQVTTDSRQMLTTDSPNKNMSPTTRLTEMVTD
jgi:ABC-type dipeptide/oligopeptide/nickel transport system permease component